MFEQNTSRIMFGILAVTGLGWCLNALFLESYPETDSTGYVEHMTKTIKANDESYTPHY